MKLTRKLAVISHTLRFIVAHPLSKGRVVPRLARFVSWQIGSRLVPGPVAVDFVNSAVLLVKPGMAGATGNVYVGLHEFNDMAFVAHYLRPRDLFVDVGANVGAYTLLAAAGVGARCLAFEPDADAVDWFRKNVNLNGVSDRVEIRAEALGSHEGQIAFTVGSDTVNHVVPSTRAGDAKRTVAVTTLDHALAGRAPDMIKIDVEGFETEVISGGQATIGRPELNCVLMELTGVGARYGFDESLLRKLMFQHGYEEFSYAPFKRRLGAPDRSANNTLFIRNKAYVEMRLKDAPPISVMGTEI